MMSKCQNNETTMVNSRKYDNKKVENTMVKSRNDNKTTMVVKNTKLYRFFFGLGFWFSPPYLRLFTTLISCFRCFLYVCMSQQPQNTKYYIFAFKCLNEDRNVCYKTAFGSVTCILSQHFIAILSKGNFVSKIQCGLNNKLQEGN